MATRRRAKPRRKPNRMVTRKEAFKISKQVLNQELELKYHDVEASSSLATDQIVNLSTIGQGVSALQRVGNEVYLKSLEFRLHGFQNATSNNAGECIRIMVIVWKSDSVPTLSNIISSTAHGNGLLAPINNNQVERLWILYDRIYKLGQFGSTGGEVEQFIQQRKFIKIPLRYKKLNYSDTIGSSAQRLYLVAFTNNNTVTAPQIVYHFRLRYTDA